jgi:hypothetical protein
MAFGSREVPQCVTQEETRSEAGGGHLRFAQGRLPIESSEIGEASRSARPPKARRRAC